MTTALVNQPSLFAIVEKELPDWLRVSTKSTDAQIRQFIKLWRSKPMFVLDLETFSTTEDTEGALDPWLGDIRLVQIGLPDGEVMVFDLGGYYDDRDTIAKRLESVGFYEALKATVESKTKRTIGHNLAFDLVWLIKKFQISPWCVGDTMILSQIYWAGITQYRHSLKAVGARLGFELDKSEQKSNWGFPLTSSQLLYAGTDVRLFPLYIKLADMCQESGLMQSVNAEFSALPAFAEMMVYGMPVDELVLDEVLEKYRAALSVVSQAFYDKFPEYSVHETAKAKANNREDGNLISAIGVRLGIKVDKADKDALNPYRDNPVVASLLASRSAKIYCDYLQGVKDSLRDGCVRGGYRQCAEQGRGRSTSGDAAIPSVNLQNPPNPSKMCAEMREFNLPPVRSVFKVPEGYAMGGTDYSAAHARIAAETTKDKAFISSYIDNVDIHCVVAAKLSTLVGKNWSQEQITKIRKEKTEDGGLATRLRNTSKNVFYGWLNGAGKAKTAETIGLGGFSCTVDFAGEIIDLLGKAFPGIKMYHDKIKRLITKNPVYFDGCKTPYVAVSGISGRRVWLPVWPKDEKGYGGAKPTDALMVAWMTVESDAKKMAMGEVRKKSAENPEWGLRLVNDCHDELVWIAKEEYFNEAGEVVWMAMQSTLAYFVKKIPVYEDYFEPTKVTYSWDECK